ETVVAEGLNDVEPDERLVLRDDDTSGGCGGCFVLCHPINPTVLCARSLTRRCGGTADAEHSKCFVRKGVWVRIPPPAHGSLPRQRGSRPRGCDGVERVADLVHANVVRGAGD